jgi:hypothetical protein
MLAGFHGAVSGFAMQLIDDRVEGRLAWQRGTGMIEVHEARLAARRCVPQVLDVERAHGCNSKIPSTSTATPAGKLDTPTAVRT